MPDRTAEHQDPYLSRLGMADRARAALHVIRTGDYQPASAYLRGVHDGLDRGLAMAWDELQRRLPNVGPAPEVPAESCALPFLEP